MQIFDNFLPHAEWQQLHDTLTSDTFPWMMGDAVRQGTETVPDKYNWQMYHLFYYNPNIISEAMPILNDLYTKLRVGTFMKAKANVNFVTSEIIEHGLHTDIEPQSLGEAMTTAIYYVNSNDGYTLFEDGTKVESVANRLVKFPCNTKHTGTSCTDQRYRMVINLNYIEV